MAQFKPFNYGQAVGQGTSNALNTMQAQEFAQNTGRRNQLADIKLEGAQADNEVRQTKTLAMATTQALKNPSLIPKLWGGLQKKGLLPPDATLESMSQEDVMGTIQRINEGATSALQAYGGGQTNKIGTYNPRDYTEGSLAKFRQTGNTGDLKRYVAPRLATIGGVASDVTLGEEGGVKPLSDLPSEVSAERQLKGGAAQGKADVELATKPEIEKQISLGKADAKKATLAFESIDKIKANILNLQDAAQAVRDGASTGPLMSKLPSIRAASVALDSMQGRLGLDVVGAVTFGALSKGELDLALNVALPIKLKGEPLLAWIGKKVAAQTKLMDYLEKQAVYLSNGGSQAEWVSEAKTMYDGKAGDIGAEPSMEELLNKYGENYGE